MRPFFSPNPRAQQLHSPCYLTQMAAPYGGVAEKVRRGSDDDANSDAEEEYEKWIPGKGSVKGVNRTQECRGCSSSFKFHVLPGQSLRDSKSVQEFYYHLLDDCPQYVELGMIVAK